MDILTVTTASHRGLAERFFLPTLACDPAAQVRERRLDVDGGGQFGSDSWQKGVTAKLHWALDHLDSIEPGATFVLSDVDIQFFDGFSTADLADLIEARGVDIMFQKEHRSPESLDVNTGFYVAKNTPWVRELLAAAIEICREAEVKNDQTAINDVLQPDSLGVRWDFLPFSYYARSQGFPPRGTIVLHHANFSGTIEEKIRQLARVRSYVNGGPLDRLRAAVSEGADCVTSGKFRQAVSSRIKRR